MACSKTSLVSMAWQRCYISYLKASIGARTAAARRVGGSRNCNDAERYDREERCAQCDRHAGKPIRQWQQVDKSAEAGADCEPDASAQQCKKETFKEELPLDVS